MHPPLYQAHPLCREHVEAFAKCHEDNPVLKFLNACGALEAEMNVCFREEKNLRRQLNRERGPQPPFRLIRAPAKPSGAEAGKPAAVPPGGEAAAQR